VEEDEINHRKICDEYIHGVSFHGFKHSRVYPVELVLPKSHALSSSTATMAKVVEIRPSDTNQQLIQKVVSIKSIVDQEMGFVSSCNILENKVAFLYVLEKRVVGFCLVENISRAYKVVSSENDDQGQTVVTNDSNDSYVNQKNKDDSDSGIKNGTGSHPVASQFVRSLSPTKALMGVHQIWCHKNFRRQGISKALLDVAREKFIFGMVIPRDMVAFSSPTMDGFCLACHYSDTQYPLVYDCL
jgi:N-acetyltransferase